MSPPLPNSDRVRKPNWVGKPAAEMRADHAATLGANPITERCLFCRWHYEGTALEGRLAARTHREQHHPEAVNRKTVRRPRPYHPLHRPGDELIADQRRAREAREEADKLATIMRGRLRRVEAEGEAA